MVDGNTAASSRSNMLLFSRSAIIKQSSLAAEFFYPLLRPYIHYLPVAKDFHDLRDVLDWAHNHDDEMQTMARNARTWAEEHLMDDSVMCYVSLLLHRYHRLQTFKPRLTQEMLKWKVRFTDTVRDWIGGETGRSCRNTSLYPVTTHPGGVRML